MPPRALTYSCSISDPGCSHETCVHSLRTSSTFDLKAIGKLAFNIHKAKRERIQGFEGRTWASPAASTSSITSSVTSSSSSISSTSVAASSTSAVAFSAVPSDVANLAALQFVVSAAARIEQISLPYSILGRRLHRSNRPYLLLRRRRQNWGSLDSGDRLHCSDNKPSLSEERYIRERHGLPRRLVMLINSFRNKSLNTNNCSRLGFRALGNRGLDESCRRLLR